MVGRANDDWFRTRLPGAVAYDGTNGGIELPSARARADYRSIYGGAQMTMGVFFCLAALKPHWRAAGVAAVALFALGFGLTRLLSLWYERVGRDIQWIVGAFEVLAGLIGGLLFASIQ